MDGGDGDCIERISARQAELLFEGNEPKNVCVIRRAAVSMAIPGRFGNLFQRGFVANGIYLLFSFF